MAAAAPTASALVAAATRKTAAGQQNTMVLLLLLLSVYVNTCSVFWGQVGYLVFRRLERFLRRRVPNKYLTNKPWWLWCENDKVSTYRKCKNHPAEADRSAGELGNWVKVKACERNDREGIKNPVMLVFNSIVTGLSLIECTKHPPVRA